MTIDASGAAFEEAQRLLIDHGSWTTDGGAYLESNRVTVLIHPLHGDVGGGEPGTVDVVVTVRPRPGRLQPGASIEIRGSAAPSVSLPLNHRGQATFRRLPPGEWSARLVAGAATATVPVEATYGNVVAWRRIPRLLAAAAAGERREIQQTYSSDDGRLRTEVLETDEARLVVRISSSAPAAVPLVRIRWALEPETMGEERTLVVPLALDEGGGAATAKYDLGSVGQAEAVRIAPAEWTDRSELTEDLVQQAFDMSIYGSARRAWEQLALAGVCAPAVERRLRAALEA